MPGPIDKKILESEEFRKFVNAVADWLIKNNMLTDEDWSWLFTDKAWPWLLEKQWRYDIALVITLKKANLNNLRFLNRDNTLIKFIDDSFIDCEFFRGSFSVLDVQGTPLGIAARYGRLDCVQYLLSIGANINAYSTDPYVRRTALHEAVDNNYRETQPAIVDALLSQGADPCAKDTKFNYRFRTHNTVLKYAEPKLDTGLVHPIQRFSNSKPIIHRFLLSNTLNALLPNVLVKTVTEYSDDPDDFNGVNWEKVKKKEEKSKTWCNCFRRK